MDKKILRFELSQEDVQIKKILNKEFLELEIYAISDIYPNRNKSNFTLESMQKSKDTLYNKPILGFFNITIDDFEEHNGKENYDKEFEQEYWDCNGMRDEKILGLIRESDNVEIVKVGDNNWIKLTCAIWTQYSYKQVKRLLKSKTKKVSVEVEVVKWHYDENEVLIIDEFVVTGITILGDKISEGIPGAHLNVLDLISSKNYSKQVQCLSFAYKKDDDKKQDKNEKEKKEDISEDDGSDTIKFDLNDENESNKEDFSHLDNTKRLEEEKLTYQEKRNLLESAVRKVESENNNVKDFYIVDFSNDFIIVNNFCENKFYRIDYTMEMETEDNKNTAKFSFNFEEMQEIEPSWKPATNVDIQSKKFVMVGDEELDIDQLFAKYTELKESCDCNNSKDEEECKMADDKADDSEDKDEEECKMADDSTEEKPEDKECNMAEEDSDEEENPEDKECNMAEEDSDEEEKEEDECGGKYAELEEKFNKLTEDYATLDSQFKDVTAKYTELTNKVEEAEKNRICSLGISMAEEEDELSADNRSNIIDKCKKFEYSSEEDIENDIATMLYQQKKTNRQKNFKANIVSPQKSSNERSADDVWSSWGVN